MKAIFLSLLVLLPAPALAYSQCGFAPFPKMGCTAEPVCVCTDAGCSWVFIGC